MTFFHFTNRNLGYCANRESVRNNNVLSCIGELVLIKGKESIWCMWVPAPYMWYSSLLLDTYVGLFSYNYVFKN